jgi:hypothetical protein
MTEAKLQRLVAKGLVLPKEVAERRALANEVVPHPQPGEAVLFTDSTSVGSQPQRLTFFVVSFASMESSCSTFLLMQCCNW